MTTIIVGVATLAAAPFSVELRVRLSLIQVNSIEFTTKSKSSQIEPSELRVTRLIGLGSESISFHFWPLC